MPARYTETMNPETLILQSAVTPALALLPAKMDTPEARVALLTIGLEESGLLTRVQTPRKPGGKPGPARGLVQMELAGGTAGVLNHASSKPFTLAICEARQVAPTAEAVWRRFEIDDVLNMAFGRLLLFTDPKPLPKNPLDLWAYYIRNWRPGAFAWRPGQPYPEPPAKWLPYYQRAVAAVA